MKKKKIRSSYTVFFTEREFTDISHNQQIAIFINSGVQKLSVAVFCGLIPGRFVDNVLLKKGSE